LGEEGGDLTPACSFPGFARFADEDDKEIQAVRGGPDEGVGGGSGKVAESGEELQQESDGIGFAVRGKAANDATGQAVEGRLGKLGGRTHGLFG
jgi:hypothetical protein